MRHCTIFFLMLVAPALAHAQPLLNVVHPLPPQAPPWLVGYEVRWPVRVIGEPSGQTAKSVLVSVPTGGWLKADGSDIAVQSGSGKLLPVAVLSHDPLGDTILQFQRSGNDPWYWIYGVNPKAPPLAKIEPPFREGITLELRDWAGDDLSNWVKVREGLNKSTTIIGNAVVTDVVQNCNPARPDQAIKFAASYRGFLDIKKEGTYRFVVNAEDAAFLFIDGFKVFERPGNNRPFAGKVKVGELEKIAGKVDLKPGVHAFEVHQAVGDSPQSRGACALTWTTPEQPKFGFVPNAAIAHPLYARVAAAERPDGTPAGIFSVGIDDTLESAGIKLFLVRFEADVATKDTAKCQWEFGDGSGGTGRSSTHVYFKENDYLASLSIGGGLPPFKRRFHVWPEPGEASPLSLESAVKAIETMEWKKLDLGRVREIFSYLLVCDQPNRWPLLDSVTQHLLAQKDLDLEARNQFITARMEALTEQGKAMEALKLAEQSAADFAKTPILQVRLQLGVAAIHQYHLKDATAASKIYKAILEEHKRVEHPNLRLAGVRWGDLFAEAGDLARASDTYRVAATLGGEKFAGTATTEATTRGALMRIAEQKLKSGEIQATRQLLERMELEYPGRRLDGLYCFMRAETDRHIGKYEDALRSYEMIFRLPQWAGYRDRATFGIADSYFRMGDWEKSLKWYKNLKEAFPKYHESQKGDEVEKLITDRLVRVKSAKDPRDAFFQGFQTGFEPDEKDWFGAPTGFSIVRAPGMQGPHAALFDVFPRPVVAFEYVRPLKNLTPGGNYWFEIWYRDVFRTAQPVGIGPPYVHCKLIIEGSKVEVLGPMNVYRTSHHQWHKLGCRLKAPLAQDFQLKLMLANYTGAYLFDALSIRPVSDRQIDSLANFLEGGKTP